MRGKLQGVVEKIDHGHHVMRACAKSAVARMYEKFCTFLRVEVLSNNVRQFGARKSLEHLDKVRSELSAGFVAECMDVHVEFPLFQRLALPIPVGEADADGKFKTKIPGIKIHLRKLRAHGLAEQDGKRYAYRLADKGTKASLMFVLFHKRVCGPLAGSLFGRAPQGTKPATKLEAAYTKADRPDRGGAETT